MSRDEVGEVNKDTDVNEDIGVRIVNKVGKVG